MKAAIKVIPIVLIIAAFTAILSNNIFSIEYNYNSNNVNRARITNYASLTDMDNNVVSMSDTEYTIENGIIKIPRTVYSTIAVQIYFEIEPISVIDNFEFSCDVYSPNIDGTSYLTPLITDPNGTYISTNGANRNPYTYYSYAFYLTTSGASTGNYSDTSKSYYSIVSHNDHAYFYGKGLDHPPRQYTYNKFVFKIPLVSITGYEIRNLKLKINDVDYEIVTTLNNIDVNINDIKNDISDIKDAIVGTETIPIDNSGEDHLLDKLDEETGVINDMIDEFRAFDISKYTGGIYAVMYMSTPWTNQEWFKAVMVVLLTLFALITVVRGLRR